MRSFPFKVRTGFEEIIIFVKNAPAGSLRIASPRPEAIVQQNHTP